MTAAFSHLMNQVATYWAPGVNDGFGSTTWAAPVAVTCRWSDKRDLIKNAQGQEVASSAQIHVDRELTEGGYIVLGDYTDEVDSDGLSDPLDFNAQRIIGDSGIPSLDASETLYKVWV